MEEFATTENIYILLPRFVTEQEEIDYNGAKYLPALVREFEWNNLKFSFIISPARVRGQSGEDRHYYPGRRERLVEAALRELAIEESINFRSKESTLDLTLSQLINEIHGLSRDSDLRLERDDIEMGVRILADVKYELINGNSELYFRPIERLVVREKDGEVYFRAQFSQFFFSRTEQFDFCFLNKKN